METWKKIRLGDACKTNTESYSTKEKWGFVNYLDTGNITNNTIDSIQFINLKNMKLPSRAKRKVRTDSIIYSTVRPNQRHFGIIKSQPENFLVSTGFAVIDVDTNILNADFLYYLLTQNTFVDNLHAVAEQTASAYPAIKPSDIENLEIEIPDLATQRKIACILSSLDRKMVKNTEINKNLPSTYCRMGKPLSSITVPSSPRRR
ncbi:restriction endonuclease subunit S [Ligilactobacillus ruminis]|nr:restriction endonuclease subunit S [Ligilactobacillus ruminis]